MPHIIRRLFKKYPQSKWWVYLVAAFPFFVFSLVGWGYGATPYYLVFGLLCILQAIWPTLLGWIVVFLAYLFGTIIYAVTLFIDVSHILSDQNGLILSDLDDSVFFSMLLVLLVGICVALFYVRPREWDKGVL